MPSIIPGMRTLGCLCLLALVQSAPAASILVDGFLRGPSIGIDQVVFERNDAVGSTVFEYDKGISSSLASFSHTIRAGFGDIGYSVTGTAVFDSPAMGLGDGQIRIQTFDRLTFGVQDGVLRLEVLFEGAFAATFPQAVTGNALSYGYGVPGGAYVQLFVLQTGTVLFVSPGANLIPTMTTDANGRTTVVVKGYIDVPISQGTAGLNLLFGGDFRCTAGLTSCSFSLDFLNSAKIGGAAVYDPTGTIRLDGVTILSESGYDYTKSLFAGAEVPEPSTGALLAFGVLALVVAQRSRRRHVSGARDRTIANRPARPFTPTFE